MDITRQTYMKERSWGTRKTTEAVTSKALSFPKGFSCDISEVYEGCLFQLTEVNINFLLPDIRPVQFIFLLKI